MNANQKLSWAYLLLSGLLVMLTPFLYRNAQPWVAGIFAFWAGARLVTALIVRSP